MNFGAPLDFSLFWKGSLITFKPSLVSIMEAREFEWESQLRFYWDREPDELNVRQCTGTFSYGYEYMGLNGRLVITPLTDRIYLTLTQVNQRRVFPLASDSEMLF